MRACVLNWDIGLMSDYLNTVSTALLSSAASLLAIKIFYGKTIDHIFAKRVEKYKSELSLTQDINTERIIYNYSKQRKYLEELWELVNSHILVCSNNKSRDDISKSHKTIDDYIYDNESYICSSIINTTNDILELTNPEEYTNNKFNDLNTKRSELIELYREFQNIK